MNKQTKIETQRGPLRLWQLLRGALLLLLMASAISAVRAQEVSLVPYSQAWKYEQSNIDLGTTWRDPGFDDSGPGWGTGVAPLGFPLNEGTFTSGLTVQTLLNRTTNGVQPRTYYFRTTFVFTNDPLGVSIVATNLIDDAAVFYLNGVEIGRPGFNAGTVVTFTSEGNRAASDVNTYGYDIFTNITPNLIQGTNVLAVEVHQTGGNSSDLLFASRVVAIIPAPVVITQQPTNQTVPENRVVNITVGVSGTPPPTFQWYKDSIASPILDATNQTFTITNSATSDTGDYFAIISNPINVVTSQVARLTVVADVNGPVLLSVKTDDTFQKIILTWDETVAQGPAIEFGNYYILAPDGNQVSVSGVAYNGSNVVLTVPTLLAGTNYSLELDYQQDLVGNTTLTVGVPINDPNGIVTNFNTFVIAPGFTRFQAYLNRPSAESLAQFVTLPVYPDNHSFAFNTNIVYWPQTAPNVEQYVMRFSGLFLAPEDGLYKFGPDHDDDMRLRVYPTAEPSGVPNELAAACCTGLLDGPTLDVTLAAGQSYYYELLVREFGGGDHAGISVILPSGVTNSPIGAAYLAVAFDPAQIQNVGIAQQPQNQSIEANHAATFSVVVTNGGNSLNYQWQVDTGSGFVNIVGANASSYTTPYQPIGNSGHQYRVLVSVPGRTVTSSAATLTVVADPTPPTVLAVRGTSGLNAIRVTFNEAVDFNSALETGNYTLTDTNGSQVNLGTATLSADLRTVTIPTTAQSPGATFTLQVENVTDVAGNPVATTNITFQTWVVSRGFILFEAFDTGGGNAVADLVNHPSYPNNPRDVAYLTSLDSRGAYPDDSHEGYGGRISGFFLPPATTNYIFYLRSDDASELHINTNLVNSTDPAGKSKVQEELTCCRAFSVLPTTNISLTAGQPYYIEVLWKEGTGGDYGQVAVKEQGDPTNPDLLTGIRGSFLATLADPVGASVTVTQQPASATIQAGTNVSLSVRAAGTTSVGSAPFAYQWQRLVGGTFVDIAGASSSNYVTGTLSAGDSGAQYRALVFVPGASATSAVATVTIGGAAPTLRSSYSGGSLTLSWDAPARLQCATTLTPPADWRDVNTGGATTYTVNPTNEFNVILDAAQAGGAGRTGSGRGTVTLTGANTLIVNISYSGMSGTWANSHFHAPGARGVSAGVAYGTGTIDSGNPGGTAGTVAGTITLLDNAYGSKLIPAQIQDLRNGLWYLNIHSSTFSGGEIRGQVDSAGARFYRLVTP